MTTRFEWERAFRSAAIKPTSAMAVGFIVATYANADGTSIHPGIERIAEGMGASTDTVGRALDTLRRLGWLTRVKEGSSRLGQADEYALSTPSQPSVQPAPVRVKEAAQPSLQPAPVRRINPHQCGPTNPLTNPLPISPSVVVGVAGFSSQLTCSSSDETGGDDVKGQRRLALVTENTTTTTTEGAVMATQRQEQYQRYLAENNLTHTRDLFLTWIEENTEPVPEIVPTIPAHINQPAWRAEA